MPEEQNTNTDDQTTNEQTSETPASFETWLGTQDETVKKLYTEHTAGLQNAVKATRQERDDLAKQIKDLLPKAEKGSELEKSLTEFSTKLEAAERRAAFAEEASRPETGCRNIKAAYALAVADNLFDRKGNPDWTAIKGAAPELFGSPGTSGNAGAGTNTSPPTGGMNEYIRRAAGRR